MPGNSRNLRASYVPIVLYKPVGSKQGIQIHDHLNAGYHSIRDDITDFIWFTITDVEQGMADFLAYKFYEDETLWWVICLFNGIIDPLADLYTGRRIRIPSQSSIELYLSRKSQPDAAVQRKNTFAVL